MSDLSRFLKENKKEKENTTYAATKSLTDEKGNPLLWTIRPISTKENNQILDDCMEDVQVKGKPGQYTQKLNAKKYEIAVIVASVVEPNLNDKKLQDSYGVKDAGDLLQAMIDDPGEYNNLSAFITDFSNLFGNALSNKVEEAKN